jgi:hypothetical protein
MRGRTLAIGVSVVTLILFLFFVPVIPITAHCPPTIYAGNPPPLCLYISYSYYGSISYYFSGVGMTYQPNATFIPPFQWSPSLPR